MRKTKIVATIGPASDNEEMLRRLLGAGVDVVRFNMKHGDIAWHSERMELVEKVCQDLGKRVGTLIDLQGPEVRIDAVPERWEMVQPGETVTFTKPGGDGIVLDHPEIFEDIKEDQQLFADDGFLEFRVTELGEGWVKAKVVEGGAVKKRKTVNFPGMKLTFPALIERDIEHLSLTARHHIDFVALSFVRSAADIETLRRELERLEVGVKVIAKIEHPDAVERFEEILAAADGIMVARGDLGIEYPMEEVPALQKMIVKKCREEGKPVIIATQMLESMIEHPRPTRAEISDVANAVYDGADAIMLSAESAAGKYPVRAVKTMVRVARRSEEVADYSNLSVDWQNGGQTAAVVGAAHKLMEFGFKGVGELKAFVVLTETGRTVEYLSRLRPSMPIFSLSKSEKTLDQLKLVWGAIPVHFDFEREPDVDIKAVIRTISELGWVHHGEKVVMIHGEEWGTAGLTSVIRVQEVV
jgi:pyruvate kinase